MTQGATGPYQLFPQLLEDANLLKDLGTESDDPNVLHGTPCCPGSVVGLVRVATSIEETAVSCTSSCDCDLTEVTTITMITVLVIIILVVIADG